LLQLPPIFVRRCFSIAANSSVFRSQLQWVRLAAPESARRALFGGNFAGGRYSHHGQRCRSERSRRAATAPPQETMSSRPIPPQLVRFRKTRVPRVSPQVKYRRANSAAPQSTVLPRSFNPIERPGFGPFASVSTMKSRQRGRSKDEPQTRQPHLFKGLLPNRVQRA